MIDNNDIIYLKQCLLKMSIPSGLEISKNKIRNPNKWLTEEELKFIKDKIYWGRSLIEMLYCIKHDIFDIPLCPTCGKLISFGKGYKKHCSISCAHKDPEVIQKTKDTYEKLGGKEYKKKIRQKNIETCLKKYGVENPLQSDEIKQKSKQTCLKRYGVEYVLQDKNIRKRIQNTCLEKYGVITPGKAEEVKEKIKQTCLEKYGVEYSFQSEEVKEKSKRTCLEKYGVEYATQNSEIKKKIRNSFINNFGYTTPFAKPEIREKIKTLFIKKYGVDNALAAKEVQDKITYTMEAKYGTRDILHTEYGINKTKETLLEKYGVDNISKYRPSRIKYENTMMDKYGSKVYCKSEDYIKHKNKIIDKISETKRKNNSFNVSKPEEFIYNILKENYTDVKREYNEDPRYPWHCDFYIPKIDTFIELQGYYTHGKHPFNKNSKEDIDRLNKLKIKYKDYYENKGKWPQIISVWTESDVLKRNKAKEENLKYIEIFTIKEEEIIQILKNEKILK